MAWKLRKDKLQEDTSKDESVLAEPAVSQEAVPDVVTFQSEPNPFVIVAPEPEFETQVEEPAYTHLAFDQPLSFEPNFSLPPAVEDEQPGIEEPLPQGPFAPFQAEEPSVPEASPSEPTFVLLDREEVAPSLVHTDTESEVPRIAPFIVDLPPVVEQATPVERVLNVRIGNFSANFTLTKEITVIGRPDSLLQSYPDVEIELDDAVSRRHAEIRHQDGGYVLVDLRSTNGTLLNGERLAPHRDYSLAHGDRVHLGDRTEIVFE